MLQLCPRNGGPAGIRNGTSEDNGKASDQPTLRKLRRKNTPLHLEKHWKLDCGGCRMWSLDAAETRFFPRGTLDLTYDLQLLLFRRATRKNISCGQLEKNCRWKYSFCFSEVIGCFGWMWFGRGLLKMFGAPFLTSWTLCPEKWWKPMRLALGAKRWSTCGKKLNNLILHLISGPPQTSASCTEVLHIWFLDDGSTVGTLAARSTT